MKIKTTVLILLINTVLSANNSIEDYYYNKYKVTKKQLKVKEKTNAITIGYTTILNKYKEYEEKNHILIDSEENKLFKINGFFIKYKYNFRNKQKTSIEILYSYLKGTTNYVGQYQFDINSYGSIKRLTYDTFYNNSIYIKNVYKIKNKINFLYGIGGGFNKWKRNINNTQLETYKWFSIRPLIGISYKYQKMNIGIFYEYQKSLKSNMIAQQYNFKLGGVTIHKISLPITYKITNNIDFNFEYSFKNQKIKKSNKIIEKTFYLYEPESKNTINEFKIGLIYKW